MADIVDHNYLHSPAVYIVKAGVLSVFLLQEFDTRVDLFDDSHAMEEKGALTIY